MDELIGRSVTVTYSRTVNLGDYNSAKFEITLSGIIEDGESDEEAAERVWKTARESVRKQYLDLTGDNDDNSG